METQVTESLETRLAVVRKRIDEACGRSGRSSDEVRLLPVSKTFGPEMITLAAECGLTIFGENRVQEARQKIPLCPGHLEWHLIGHLQRNKVKDAVRLFSMIHSVDSLRLIEALDPACSNAGVRMPVCIEVNVSGEPAKHGVAPEDLGSILRECDRMQSLEVVGLMTMPPMARDPEDARPFFRSLRELRDAMCGETGYELAELSMGMSYDFEVAIEEGATWVRIGSGIFGERQG